MHGLIQKDISFELKTFYPIFFNRRIKQLNCIDKLNYVSSHFISIQMTLF